MPGRPREELSPQATRLRAAYKKVRANQQAAPKDRRRLIQAVAEIDKTRGRGAGARRRRQHDRLLDPTTAESTVTGSKSGSNTAEHAG